MCTNTPARALHAVAAGPPAEYKSTSEYRCANDRLLPIRDTAAAPNRAVVAVPPAL